MKNAVVEPPVNKFYLTEESFSEGSQRESVSVSEEEFFRAAAKRRNGKLDAGRTVRSGYAYDFDSTDQVPFSDFERAAKVKAELGEGKVEGLGSRPAYRVIKRAFDVVFSGLVLVCFSWLYLLIALIVKVDDPKGPVFFKQTRVGMNGKEFQMLKFRSMCVDAKEKLASLQELNEKTGPVFKIADDPRITRVGKWLRKLSLASVIIGAPGDGESTKSLSRSANSSLDLQLCERRPGLCFANNPHYKPFKFLSIAVFRDARGAFNRVFTHLLSLAFLDPFRGHAEGFCPSFSSILTEVMCNDGGECCCGIA
ncbi:hypothetical protein C1875_13780 [Eggerthella lenta]|uniref:Bacterial sugar transferase domain-containing protein n=2 Tax=Eggerthella lenta TaxID=84112 RepID=A0A369M893_EGGLN|nr:sugar transferase [Eggerthella lenta]MDB1805539.1 sugar transferase [Eggerthella lenta]RDB66696.1 hypothetical protein C1875_13780 [Eggerthella lenta]